MTHILTVTVTTKDYLTAKQAARLLRKLIAVGQEEANNAPGDYDDPDTQTAQGLTIKIKPR